LSTTIPFQKHLWHNRIMIETCPECGAAKVEGMDCREQLGALLSGEWDDPELAAEHFKTVACYNLQHPAQFTDEALAGLKAAFIENFEGKISIAGIRKRFGRGFDGRQHVLKPETERRLVRRDWKITIADVYLPGQPQGVAQRVRDWEKSVYDSLKEK
jgi:hypothetical protein